MLRKLLSRFTPRTTQPAKPAPDNRAAVAQQWDAWQAQRNLAAGRYVDWADHPTVMGLLQEELFGHSATTVFDVLKQRYPAFATGSALSLCSGDGAFEKLLVQHGVFGSVVGIDLSPVRVQQATAACAGEAHRLSFRVGDVNRGDFGEQTFDVVFAKAALHHVEDLESLFAGVRRCLRPGGRLVTIDFFGPTRFQWTDGQLGAANRILSTLPDDLVRRADGSLYREVGRPTVEYMVALDPSEAVRSGELYQRLAESFDIELDYLAGGALLNHVFDGAIVNNFVPGIAEHDHIIRDTFRQERELMARGEIGSDFRFIVAASQQALAMAASRN